ncbi:MAG: DUF2231 domain-containing protein [Phycisphaeraceae bacterium]
MRAVAQFKSHPIHPMLISFPIAFLFGGFICNLVGWVIEGATWWTVGAWMALAGIITALIAAVPGVVDYVYAVPPKSSAKQRATWHMVVNSGAVILFVAAWIIRGAATAPPTPVTLLLELAGLVLLTAGGWMGGTLIHRNFVGPEHRYANKGKWREQTIELDRNQEALDVAEVGELDVDQMKLLRVGDRRIVLARTSDGYTAFDDHCSHRGGSLAGGVLICGTVQCLWHGSQFDVHTGQPQCGPAHEPIRTYPVREAEGKVRLLTENL